MLLLCIGGYPPSCLLLSTYKGHFLVYLKSLRLLFVCSLFNYSGEQSLLIPWILQNDIMSHVEVCLVYLNNQSS
jgi:hypothetical protein